MKISGRFIEHCVETTMTQEHIDTVNKLFENFTDKESDAMTYFGVCCMRAGYTKGLIDGALTAVGGILAGIVIETAICVAVDLYKEKKQKKQEKND